MSGYDLFVVWVREHDVETKDNMLLLMYGELADASPETREEFDREIKRLCARAELKPKWKKRDEVKRG